MDYKSYIVSSEWRSKHKGFLKRSHYRCSFFPFIKCGKKGRYNVHQKNYENLGSEHLRVDVNVVCPIVHNFILHMNYEILGSVLLMVDVIVVCPFVHNFILLGLLSGFKRPSQQKRYPNTAQRLAHCWCCQPVFLRGALVVGLAVNLLKMLMGW